MTYACIELYWDSVMKFYHISFVRTTVIYVVEHIWMMLIRWMLAEKKREKYLEESIICVE